MDPGAQTRSGLIGVLGIACIPEPDIYEDYRKFFGEEPPLLGAVALMTDTDNTGEEAVAWYGDITLESQEAPR